MACRMTRKPAATRTAIPVAAIVANVCPRRIFLPTADTRLIALNADTGKMCEDFGDKGQVDLRANIGTFSDDPDEVEAQGMLAFSLAIGSHFIAAEHGGRSRGEVLERAIQRLLA